MYLIQANCPSCDHEFTIRLDSIEAGTHNKTYTCISCAERVRFQYNLSMTTGKRLYVNSSWMRNQYLDQGKTMQEIAEICGVTAMTIRDWLIKHNIPTRSRGEKGK